MKQCIVCQASKNENVSEIWIDASMDFITRLSNSNDKEGIFVVVDKVKQVCSFHCSVSSLLCIGGCSAYIDNVFKLHGWTRSIVSDRDPIFLSSFWKGLFTSQGVVLFLSSQTDG